MPVENVNGEIATALGGMDADNQRALDAKLMELDGTPNKGRLGRDASLAVSMAAARAAANEYGLPVSLFGGGGSQCSADTNDEHS